MDPESLSTFDCFFLGMEALSAVFRNHTHVSSIQGKYTYNGVVLYIPMQTVLHTPFTKGLQFPIHSKIWKLLYIYTLYLS
jgi:hypothetical protein